MQLKCHSATHSVAAWIFAKPNTRSVLKWLLPLRQWTQHQDIYWEQVASIAPVQITTRKGFSQLQTLRQHLTQLLVIRVQDFLYRNENFFTVSGSHFINRRKYGSAGIISPLQCFFLSSSLFSRCRFPPLSAQRPVISQKWGVRQYKSLLCTLGLSRSPSRQTSFEHINVVKTISYITLSYIAVI